MQAGRPSNLLTRPVPAPVPAVAATCSSKCAGRATTGSSSSRVHPANAAGRNHAVAYVASGTAQGSPCAGHNCAGNMQRACRSKRSSKLTCSCVPPHAGSAWPTTDAPTEPHLAAAAADVAAAVPGTGHAEPPSSRVTEQPSSNGTQTAEAVTPGNGSSSCSSNGSSASGSSSAKAVLQPVTYSAGHSLPPQPNWQSAVAALQVRGTVLPCMSTKSHAAVVYADNS